MTTSLSEMAEQIGADFALIVYGGKKYTRFYKRGSWEESRNCMLYWNERYGRWDNSSELSFSSIEYGLRVTNRKYDLIDFVKQERKRG